MEKSHLKPLFLARKPTLFEMVTRKKLTQTSSGNFKKTLTRYHLTMYGVGTTIGAGIFALTGIAVQYAGPSLFISFALAGLMCLCSAFMYAELCSRFPSNGSSFTYVYMTFGELAAWIVGWYLIVCYSVTTSGLARALTSYFVGLLAILGLNLPSWLSSVTIFGFEDCCPLAAVVMALLCYVNCRGTADSEKFNTYLTIAKILTLLLIVAVAFSRFEIDNMTPFLAP